MRPLTSPEATVFIVDDDEYMRESLELLIQDQGWQAKTFASAQEFLDYPRPLSPSCLVLDVSLPGLSGLDLQKRVVAERRDMPIVFITGYGDIPMSVGAMKAGAVEFLTKPFKDDVLLTAVRQGIDRSRAAVAVEMELAELRNRYASLTPRERDVTSLVVTGLLNKQVAGELGITERTVKEHRGQVMQKMKAGSLAELVKITSRLDQDGAGKNVVS